MRILLSEIAYCHSSKHFQFGSSAAEIIRGEQLTAEHLFAEREHRMTVGQIKQLEINIRPDRAVRNTGKICRFHVRIEIDDRALIVKERRLRNILVLEHQIKFADQPHQVSVCIKQHKIHMHQIGQALDAALPEEYLRFKDMLIHAPQRVPEMCHSRDCDCRFCAEVAIERCNADAARICNIRHLDGFNAVAEKHLGADLNCTLNPLCFETFLRMLIFHLTNLLFYDRLGIRDDSPAITP